MRKVLIFLASISLTQGALAASVDIACYWEAPSSNASGMGAEAARFYSDSGSQAYFAFDVEKSVVKNADKGSTQDIVLRDLSISQYGEDVEIRVGTPNMKGITGIGATLIIHINPYTLQSTMILAIYNKSSKQAEAHWLRRGQCSLKKF